MLRLVSKRTAFLRMMGDAANGEFAIVVVYHLGRFSRNPSEYYPLMGQLEAHRVNLVALNDPEYDATDPGHEARRAQTKGFFSWSFAEGEGLQRRPCA